MQVVRQDGVCRITITTDPIWADFAFAKLVQNAVQSADHTIHLDVHRIQMLHSPGLANLVNIYVHLQRRGKRLLLVGINDANRKVLMMTRLDQLFELE